MFIYDKKNIWFLKIVKPENAQIETILALGEQKSAAYLQGKLGSGWSWIREESSVSPSELICAAIEKTVCINTLDNPLISGTSLN